MKTRRKLRPGQPGTKKLMQQYGDRLVCVRYRYDIERKEKVKTVELIIARDAWEPDSRRIPPNKRMPLRVKPTENAVKRQIKAAGGRWNQQRRWWELPYAKVIELELTDRIIGAEEHTPKTS